MQAHSHARALAYRAAIAYEKQRRVLGRVSTVLCAYHPSTTTNLDSSRRPSVGVRCTFFVPNLPHTHTHTQWTEGHTRIITRPPTTHELRQADECGGLLSAVFDGA